MNAAPPDKTCPDCGATTEAHTFQDVHILGNGIDAMVRQHSIVHMLCQCKIAELAGLTQARAEAAAVREAARPAWQRWIDQASWAVMTRPAWVALPVVFGLAVLLTLVLVALKAVFGGVAWR